MEKRKLISLRAVLLGYLVQTAVSCIVAAVLWLLLFLLCIDSGWLLPANRAARGLERGGTEHSAVPDGENI